MSVIIGLLVGFSYLFVCYLITIVINMFKNM